MQSRIERYTEKRNRILGVLAAMDRGTRYFSEDANGTLRKDVTIEWRADREEQLELYDRLIAMERGD